jgi:hypothetical protein
MCEVFVEKTAVLESAASKVCPKCHIKKPLVDFPKNKRRNLGVGPWCKGCSNAGIKRCKEANASRETIVVPESKLCSICKIKKGKADFGRSKLAVDGLNYCCKKCDKTRRRFLRYGVTEEWYRTTLEAQGHCCAICKVTPSITDKRLCVDHDHLTEKTRGLLCDKCNRGLGHFKDNTPSIKKTVDYLNFPLSKILYKRGGVKDIKSEILSTQNGLCKICGADLLVEEACLDHCHKTGLIRGYLCNGCNSGLGQFKESVETLNSAISYLFKYKTQEAG